MGPSPLSRSQSLSAALLSTHGRLGFECTMLARKYRTLGWVVTGTKPAGLLLLMTSLVVSLACDSPALPVVDVPSREPVSIAPTRPSTTSQEAPTLGPTLAVTSGEVDGVDSRPTRPSNTGPAVPDAVNNGYDSLMAAALESLPHFNRLRDDPGLSRFGRIPVNLDSVAEKMAESGDISYVPVLLDFLRVQLYYEGRTTLSAYLEQLVGDETPDPTGQDQWTQWSEWLANHPKIEPPVGYPAWKGRFLAHIDPDMGAFFYEGVKTRIRLEEAVWGGVSKDGIPDLIDPPSILAEDAEYLNPTDRVFGISINGEHRAYPLRILNPHEMANDVLGGVPIALAY